jgi:hypothetical protein
VGPEKYDETASAMIVQLKYGSRVLSYRLERMQELLGIPMPATTQWEAVEEAAEVIKPAREELIRQAAQGEVLQNDSTSMRVLDIERDPADERTSVFTRGIVSTASGRKIRSTSAAVSMRASTRSACCYISLRYSCTNWTAIAPSPTAEATRFTDPERTSPAAKTPGRLVSNRNGGRARPHDRDCARAVPVRTNPFASRSMSEDSQSVRGVAPMKLNTAGVSMVLCCPVLLFAISTAVR